MFVLKASIKAGIFCSVVLVFAAIAVPVFAGNQVSISIDAKKPGPVINKNVYGQFAEHLGRGVYEGMWVGPDSAIPNTKGWRNDVVAALKKIHVLLVRWPGGCFADEYHWRDGIGVRENRPVKMNTNWGNVEERNAVGTHEFFDLIDLLGADAYVNGNLGSGTPQEMAEWLEYMTGDGKSTLAELRRKNGRDKPFKVAFFGIGNEAWGCGGNMKVDHYTSLFNQYASFLKAPKAYMPKIIASGGHDDDTSWTDYLTRNIHEQWNMRFDGVSFHYYTLPTGTWEKKGKALGFGEDQWISTLKNTMRMDSLIRNNVAKMEVNDPKNKIAFNVDEWGTWYDVEPGTNPGFLYQQNSLRDALVAALNFNIFHEHAARVRMTNIAQMVNVLQAMILTDKDKILLTPTYHAFEMYVPFQNATNLPLTISNNHEYSFGKTSIPAISASAARALDGKVYLSLVNTNPNESVEIDVDVAGEKIEAAKGRVLTAKTMDAHNTFIRPQSVQPDNFNSSAKAGRLTLNVPAKAIVVVVLE
ncbi:alpha-N-arabinofuranosidase [Undibacterium sp. Tian12W]|uniref:alpha-N-arabinofuranosidase n=1 Tax=Undibacterium sp. Tian12W TaxID=3413054 RepID=UPI003BF1853A